MHSFTLACAALAASLCPNLAAQSTADAASNPARPGTRTPPAAGANAASAAALSLPLAFERLPSGDDAWLARGPGYAALVSATGASLRLLAGGTEHRLGWSLPHADPLAPMAAEEPMAGRSHYLLGNDPQRWRTGVPHHAKVRCAGVWPGIDVVWYGHGRELEFDFVVRPGADASRVRLELDGADALHLEPNGDLRLRTPHGDVVQRAPLAWQQVDGARRAVSSRYRIIGPRMVAIDVCSVDASRELVIDPVISYASYFGGTGADGIHDLARDAQGNLYLTGLTTSANLRVVNPYQPVIKGLYDFFVAKLDPTGTTLLYSTFVGGAAGGFGTDEWPVALAVDAQGRAIVLGRTEATDFPTVNAFQPALAGKVDAVLFALSPNGSQLAFSTYLGGSGFEMDRDNIIDNGLGGVVIDGNGFITAGGYTESIDLPVRNARQGQLLGGSDAWIARFDAAGNAVYVSYFGGTGDDQLSAFEPGPAGSVLMAGGSTGGWPTTPGAYDRRGSGGFVTRLDPSTQQIVWSTSFPVGIACVAFDPAGDVYMAGASSGGVPTTMGAWLTEHGGAYKGHWSQGWVGKLDQSASRLIWATYYGNSSNDESFASVVVDDLGHACTFGTTSNHTSQATSAPLLVKWNTEGSWPVYELEVGGRSAAGSVALLERTGSVWVAGTTWTATGFLNPGGVQPVHGGNRDGFLARIDDSASQLVAVTLPADRAASEVLFGAVTLDGSAPAGGVTVTLSSSTPSLVVPSQVPVRAGSATAVFPAVAVRVSANVQATITATWGASQKTASIRLWPGPAWDIQPIAVPGAPDGVSDGRGINALGEVAGSTKDSFFRFGPRGLQVLGTGEVNAINDRGQMAGGDGASAFRFTDGTGVQILGALQPGMFSVAHGINASGQVVGQSDYDNGQVSGWRAWRYTDGLGMVNLGTLGGDGSAAFGINALGAVVGDSFLAGNGTGHAFLWRAGAGMQDLGSLPGYQHSVAYAINNGGLITGALFDSSYANSRAFLLARAGGMVDLGVLPGGQKSGGLALNAHGHVAGWSSAGTPQGAQAVLFAGAGPQPLEDDLSAQDAFAWDLVQAKGINDRGEITGYGSYRPNSYSTAFRLVPKYFAPYGQGCAGSLAQVPGLTGLGYPVAGNVVTVCASGRESAIAIVMLGGSKASVALPGGCTLLVGAPLMVLGAFVLSAEGTHTIAVPLPIGLAPVVVQMQAFVFDDAGANGAFTASGGVQLTTL